MSFPRYRKCPNCKGSSQEPTSLDPDPCSQCDGLGKIWDEDLPEEYPGDDHDCFDNDRGGTGHGDISHSDADPGL